MKVNHAKCCILRNYREVSLITYNSTTEIINTVNSQLNTLFVHLYVLLPHGISRFLLLYCLFRKYFVNLFSFNNAMP